MYQLQLDARPARMPTVRRRRLVDGIYLIYLAKIFRIDSRTEALWDLADGTRTIADLLTVANLELGLGMSLEELIQILLKLQGCGFIESLNGRLFPPLPPEDCLRDDGAALHHFIDSLPLVAERSHEGYAEAFKLLNNRLLRIGYEAYFAIHGKWTRLSEDKYRRQWCSLFIACGEGAITAWRNELKITEAKLDLQRGFCQLRYLDAFYEGPLDSRI